MITGTDRNTYTPMITFALSKGMFNLTDSAKQLTCFEFERLEGYGDEALILKKRDAYQTSMGTSDPLKSAIDEKCIPLEAGESDYHREICLQIRGGVNDFDIFRCSIDRKEGKCRVDWRTMLTQHFKGKIAEDAILANSVIMPIYIPN